MAKKSLNIDEFEFDPKAELQGELSKWTNYFYGWQSRWVVLRDGILAYYYDKSGSGCCKAIVDIRLADIAKHEFDRNRFEIKAGDQTFWFRARDEKLCDEWIQAFESNKQLHLSQKGSSHHHNHGPTFSQAKITPIVNDIFREHEELVIQVIKLQGALTQLGDGVSPAVRGSLTKEADALKSISSDLITTVKQLLEVVSPDNVSEASRVTYSTNSDSHDGESDREEELETTLLRKDEGDGEEDQFDDAESFHPAIDYFLDKKDHKTIDPANPYFSFVESKVKETLAMIEQDFSQWEVAHKEGEMTILRQSVMENDIPCDRLRATAFIPGVTAKELAAYFMAPQFKKEFDTTVDTTKTLERFDERCFVEHIMLIRPFLSAQRDVCLLCHYRLLDDGQWLALSNSVKHDGAPEIYTRVVANVGLLCRTRLRGNAADASRENVSCELTYIGQINPGGWLPAAAVREVSKRECPKFIRSLCDNARRHYKQLPVLL